MERRHSSSRSQKRCGRLHRAPAPQPAHHSSHHAAHRRAHTKHSGVRAWIGRETAGCRASASRRPRVSINPRSASALRICCTLDSQQSIVRAQLGTLPREPAAALAVSTDSAPREQRRRGQHSSNGSSSESIVIRVEQTRDEHLPIATTSASSLLPRAASRSSPTIVTACSMASDSHGRVDSMHRASNSSLTPPM